MIPFGKQIIIILAMAMIAFFHCQSDNSINDRKFSVRSQRNSCFYVTILSYKAILRRVSCKVVFGMYNGFFSIVCGNRRSDLFCR